MQRITLTIALVVPLVGSVALAQPPGFGRPQNPPLSPYLNLLNPNAGMGFNYYQLYRPQTEFRQAYTELNRDLYAAERNARLQARRLDERLSDVEARVRPGAGLSTTGHRSTFMSYGGYFPAGPAGPLGR